MRGRTIPALAGLAAFAILTMGADSCSMETKDTADGGASKKATIGNTITLEGFDTKLAVRPERIIDPLPVGSYDSPMNNGSRFVGVAVSMKNVGSGAYNDSPSNGAVLITARHEQASSAIVSGGPCAGDFAIQTIIAPGSTRRGCIPFEVPGSQQVETFQFTLNSGFGPQAGEWRVR